MSVYCAATGMHVKSMNMVKSIDLSKMPHCVSVYNRTGLTCGLNVFVLFLNLLLCYSALPHRVAAMCSKQVLKKSF